MKLTHCQWMELLGPKIQATLAAECELCAQCDNLRGWVYARTIFAEPMLTYLHASMKDKRCALDYQPNKV
jgi:hypothetical protein